MMSKHTYHPFLSLIFTPFAAAADPSTKPIKRDSSPAAGSKRKKARSKEQKEGEDTPSFDYAGFVVGDVEREAFLFGKGDEPAVLAGSPFFTEVFEQLGCQCVSSIPLHAFPHITQSRMACEGGRHL